MTAFVAPRSPIEQEARRRSPAEQLEHERRDVAQHYEHHPEIFQMVLDRRLTYSTGVFLTGTEDLDTAQEQKFARLRQLLAIRPGQKVLDVGCGWGSNLLYLAQHTEGTFHGVTLSARQRAVALERARSWGVAERVRIDLCHIEELAAADESYDAILFSGSIVHMHQREAIHRMVGRILRPGGRVLVSDCFYPRQVRGDRNSRATHFIFVTALGYCRLLGLADELGQMEQAGLDIVHVEDLTRSYVLTLGHWIDNVRKNRQRIEELAPGFARILQGYMTVARASFHQRSALEYLILAVKGQPDTECLP
jgi:cyclopropane-fatty-acyl-phospholipid synthase